MKCCEETLLALARAVGIMVVVFVLCLIYAFFVCFVDVNSVSRCQATVLSVSLFLSFQTSFGCIRLTTAREELRNKECLVRAATFASPVFIAASVEKCFGAFGSSF